MDLDLPTPLRPTALLVTELPSGRSVGLPHCYPRFREWTGRPVAYTFGDKKVLDFDGAPVFAELYVLRLLQHEGWDGVWVSSYRRKYLRDMPIDSKLSNSVRLERRRETLLRTIAPGWSGCFDVLAWRDDDVLFCECKRRGEDELNDNQLAWIEAALRSDVTNLLVAEWDTR